MDKVVSVVVTYNRLNLLKQVIESLRNQSFKLSAMIVVDNGTTDGTHEWLDKQPDLLVIHQANVGGSGGFYRGIEKASKMDCDWVWCMDDDVFPTNNCLETLLKTSKEIDNIGILCPLRVMSGKPFVSEAKSMNMSNPLKDIHVKLTATDIKVNSYVYIEGMAFEGPLIKNEVIKKIGLPNKELFILYDDTDYSYRTVVSGYKVALVRDAILEKYDFQSKTSYREEKTKNRWKLFYQVRNTAYFGHHYGKNFLVRYTAAIPFLLRMYGAITFNFIKGHKYKFSDYKTLTKALILGLREKLGRVELQN